MKLSIGIDLDGTLAPQEGWNGDINHFVEPFPGAVEFVNKLAESFDIVIYTCRTCESVMGYNARLLIKHVKEWLDKHNFVYHEIWVGQGKPPCYRFIDDRGITCNSEHDPSVYEKIIKQLI